MPNQLTARLASEIETCGPIGFDHFMTRALYDSEHGYYMGGGNPEDDFRTAVDTSPLFAAMLVRRLDRAWRELECPDPFSVLELGSGRGVLAAAAMRVARELPWGPVLCWTGVEIGPSRRRYAQLNCPRARFVRDLGQVNPLPRGVILANEYLDALPFRLAKRGPGGWIELRVGLSEPGSLGFVEFPADNRLNEYCARWAGAIPTGGVVEVRHCLDGLFVELARLRRRSLSIFVDYGGTADQVHSLRLSSGTALAYRGMQVSSDLLEDPGSQDLTAHVNFDAVVGSAGRAGFTRRAQTTQAEFLIELGIGSYLPALAKVPSIDRQRYAIEREAVTRLLDPRHMGSFKVLELERRPDPVSETTNLRG